MIDFNQIIYFSCPDECGQIAVPCSLRMILNNETFCCEACGCEFYGEDVPEWLSSEKSPADVDRELYDVMCGVYLHIYANKPYSNFENIIIMYNLDWLYQDAQCNIVDDTKKYFDIISELARKNHIQAQYELGKCYADGKIVEQNYTEAVKWYQEAATQGHIDAQYAYGCSLWYGRGVPEDREKALVWLRRSASAGGAEQQFRVGLELYKANSSLIERRDFVEAEKWLKLAAEGGCQQAFTWLDKIREIESEKKKKKKKKTVTKRKSPDTSDTCRSKCVKEGERIEFNQPIYRMEIGDNICEVYVNESKEDIKELTYDDSEEVVGTLNFDDEFAKDSERVMNIFRNIFDENVFVAPNIPANKLHAALRKYAPDVAPDDVLVLVDDTVWGGAKDGLLITQQRIYTHEMFSDWYYAELSADVNVFTAVKKEIWVNDEKLIGLCIPSKATVNALVKGINALCEFNVKYNDCIKIDNNLGLRNRKEKARWYKNWWIIVIVLLFIRFIVSCVM